MDSIIVSPAISVIMPVYNAGAFLKEAIDSILQQSFIDFEFFIIDDASTDNSVAIIQSYTDKRIRFIQKPANTGYTDSLNMAIQLSKGKYIARMDADDISLPQRFQQQFQYLEAHTDTLVLGTAYSIIGADSIVKLPISYEEAKIVSLMNVPVAHPTVVMRSELFNKYQLLYNKDYEPAEDYNLWINVLQIGKIENLPEVLLCYRRHGNQQSITRLEKLIRASNEIRLYQLNELISFDYKTYTIPTAIDILTKKHRHVDGLYLKQIMDLVKDVYAANTSKNNLDDKLLYQYLRDVWLFNILRFDKPLLKDIILVTRMESFKITRMGIFFIFKFLNRIIFFFFTRLANFIKQRIGL